LIIQNIILTIIHALIKQLYLSLKPMSGSPVVSLCTKPLLYCSVLVGSGNGFKHGWICRSASM